MALVGKVTFVGDDDILYDDADAFLDCIREELPYRIFPKRSRRRWTRSWNSWRSSRRWRLAMTNGGG